MKQEAYARLSDPVSSWIAAAGIDAAQINKNRAAVIGFLLARHTAIQEEASTHLEKYEGMTPQRTRTVFSDLYKEGILTKTGQKRPTKHGRMADVYALAENTRQGGLF